MSFTLFTTAAGTPILIGDNGLVIEPEIRLGEDVGSSIVTLPHTNRDGKAKLHVREKFAHIAGCLRVVNILDKSTSERAAEVTAQLIGELAKPADPAPADDFGLTELADAIAAYEPKEAPAKPKRGKKKESV
jgi:hypothetical protein